ncbi:MAG: hypothetical protein HY012_04210 [Acidobacteria bacterium]|nr:hypothetical protein [Acidobacteriota bacterium]
MEQAEPRAPILRSDLEFRPLSGGYVFLYHPEVASQVLDARAAAALQLCRGQSLADMMPEVCTAMDYDCTQEEWAGFINQLRDFGIFEGHPKRYPRVRLFDPGPALDFLTHRCRWLFTAPAVVALFLLFFAGLWLLLSNWGLFVSEVGRITSEYPLPAVFLYYLCFMPIGLLHELGHGVVCRWFGGEVLEVGVRKNNANLYVLSNTSPLNSPRQLIPYFAGGAFLDMFAFFVLVNLWLLWPNFVTMMFLLPQALFVLQFSYAMEDGSDLAKIVSQWTGIREAGGRLAFVKEFMKARPASSAGWKRAVIYFSSIVLQGVAAALLIWSWRTPIGVRLWPGFVLSIPFWPPLLYLIYRLLRKAIFGLPAFIRSLSARTASAA